MYKLELKKEDIQLLDKIVIGYRNAFGAINTVSEMEMYKQLVARAEKIEENDESDSEQAES